MWNTYQPQFTKLLGKEIDEPQLLQFLTGTNRKPQSVEIKDDKTFLSEPLRYTVHAEILVCTVAIALVCKYYK
jgi:hypothetical protein